MKHVIGFVAPVPEDRREDYFKHARVAAEVFRENGALQYAESWATGLPEGEATSFPLAVRRQAGEGIVFTYAVWPSKEAADKAMEKIMGDPRMQFGDDLPFDGKRAFWGGFEMVVEG